MSTRHSSTLHQAGFTLMEMIISLVVLGLLSAVMLPLLSLPATAYFDAQRRVELQSQMALVRAKLTDDLQYAMPGSVRSTCVGTRCYLEYLEVKAVGRYRVNGGDAAFCPATPACSVKTGNAMAPACATETCFTTTGQLTPAITPTINSDYVAVLGDGGPAVNPYLPSPASPMTRIRARTWLTDHWGLRFDATRFPTPGTYAGASNRVYIVSQPVSYECNPATGRLTRYWGYGVTVAQPTAFGGGVANARLADTLNYCRISVSTVGLRSTVSLRLRLTRTSGGQPSESIEGLIQLSVREP
ncbi:MAG TPA: type II secretion system protein [Aquabacterium sp.]|nr:type II secretion system protein [Aquabacterium sp.]